MNIWLLRTKKDGKYFFEANELEKVIWFCNDKKNNFIFMKRYNKAVKLDDIVSISVEILSNEYKQLILSHKKKANRLSLSEKENDNKALWF